MKLEFTHGFVTSAQTVPDALAKLRESCVHSAPPKLFACSPISKPAPERYYVRIAEPAVFGKSFVGCVWGTYKELKELCRLL